MFTGIIQGTAEVVQIDSKHNFRTHSMRLPAGMATALELGASIAHNGCCLTVTRIDGDLVSFDLMQETLRLTNLGELNVGSYVNVERAAHFGDEIGGHAMSGHIITTAEVVKITESENNHQIRFKIDHAFTKYIFTKGYIGIDGISLTIGDVADNQFEVNLIPETLQRTTIGSYRLGSRINIEIDPQTQAIVDTVERTLSQQQQGEPTVP